MTEHATPVHQQGHYRIVERRGRSGDAAGRDYVVVDATGLPLRYEPNLDDAKAWLQARLCEDGVEPESLPPPRTRAARRR